jgi:hypothetical protein
VLQGESSEAGRLKRSPPPRNLGTLDGQFARPVPLPVARDATRPKPNAPRGLSAGSVQPVVRLNADCETRVAIWMKRPVAQLMS